jgi:hypothetical protein
MDRRQLAGFVAGWIVFAVVRPAVAGDAEVPVRLSLPTMGDVEAWQSAGLRVEVGYGFGDWRSPGAAARNVRTHALVVRPRFRLGPHWSLALELEYAIARGRMRGFAWSTTVTPAYHLNRYFAFAAGVGVTGLSVADQRYYGLPDTASGDAFSHDISRSVPTGECSGTGLGALARADFSLIVGPLFATGPFLEARTRWIDCRAVRSYTTNLETGEEVVRRQSWSHLGFAAGWSATWR